MMSDVATPDEDSGAIRRLADAVKARRLDLGLSLRAAADAAGIARNTWTSLEEGSRRTAVTSYAAIERVLQWKSGSIEQAKAGNKPTPLPANTSTQEPAVGLHTDNADEALLRIMRSEIPDIEKARIVRLIIAEQERARQKMLAMVDDLIAETQR
jgi:transcriptional regulator with XRE-family HTH domain